MPYPFQPGDKLTPLHDRLNEAVEAAMGHTDQSMNFTTGVFTLRANQAITHDVQTTVTNFYLREDVSHPDIGEYVSLNEGSGRDVWTFLKSGYYRVLMKTQWSVNTTGHRYIYPRIDNVQVDTISAPPGNGALLTVQYEFPSLWFNAGQDIRMRVMQNAGATASTLALRGSATGFETQVFFEYLGGQ